jgi:very-short-patch-repair endonuclease
MPQNYHDLAESRGFKCLNPEVPTTKTKTTWQCAEGHTWEATYGNVQQGSGCPYCVGKAPKTPQDYYHLAESRGLIWLGPEVPTTKTKTTWQCAEEHTWEATYNNILKGSSCPHCAGNAPKTLQDYHDLAESRGFKCLNPEVPTTKTKTTWQCAEGHTWEADYHSIQQGTGCPYCAGKAPKTPKDYYHLAEARGFIWLGPEVPNTAIKTTWQCVEGHTWEVDYQSIKMGNGCPYCYGNIPKTPADYHELAEARGFVWLGPEVPNTAIKTTWQCVEGHTWEAAYNNIQQGSGCPDCNEYRGEARVAQALDNLGIPYKRQKTFLGCRSKRLLPFDFYLPGQKIIIEYHGIQHYEVLRNDFFGGSKGLTERQERDQIKARFASENGYKLIIIPYTDFDRIDEIIKALSLTPQLPT